MSTTFPSYYSDALHLYAGAVMSLRQNGFQLNNIKGKDVIGEIWNRPNNGTPGKWRSRKYFSMIFKIENLTI